MTTPSRNIALVTGAADRIGAALALRLADEGYAVIVHYRASAEKAATVVAAIEAQGGRAAALRADLTRRSERAALIAEAGRLFGPLTVLVNNASLFERDSLADIDGALWDAHFALHAEAPVFLARDFAAQLPADLEGNIVNIIDERVLHMSPAYFSYSLSKATLWAATRTLAQSLAPRIRVNAIAPGPAIAAAGQSPDDLAKAWERLPLKQAADPEGIADGLMAILGLGSMTGQMLALDGGQHLEWSDRRGPTPRK